MKKIIFQNFTRKNFQNSFLKHKQLNKNLKHILFRCRNTTKNVIMLEKNNYQVITTKSIVDQAREEEVPVDRDTDRSNLKKTSTTDKSKLN